MKTARAAGLGLIMVLGLSTISAAGEFCISLASGVFFAGQKSYREIYGSGIPLSLEVWLKFRSHLGVSTGLDWLGDRGIAKPFNDGDDIYPLKFNRITIPVTVFYELGLKVVDIRFGAGMCFHSYKEEWRTVALGFKGTKISPRLYVTAEYPLLSRLKLFGSFAFDAIPVRKGSYLIGNVNLGGVRILGGVTFRVH